MAMNKVYVIGMGPGAEEYLTPAARRKIEECDILLGSSRFTALFPHKESLPFDFSGQPPASIAYILSHRAQRKLGVLVSGDPGLFGFLGVLRRYLSPSDYEVIPGISSIQVAFSRLGQSWEDAFIYSVHGRQLEGLIPVVNGHGKVALLADGHLSPGDIAGYLLEGGVRDRELVICYNLSYAEESITRAPLEEALSLGAAPGPYIIIIEEKG